MTEETNYELVERVIDKTMVNILATIEEIPYQLSMDAIFGQKMSFQDWKDFFAARDVIVEVLQDAVSDLKSITKADLIEQRLEQVESELEDYRNERRKDSKTGV